MLATLRVPHIATACAMLFVLNAARADVVTQPTDQGAPFLIGSTQLNLGTEMLDALDATKVSVLGYGAATATVTKDSDGFYTGASVSAPVTSITYDPSKLEIFGMGTSGGFTLTAPVLKQVTTGGTLTVTDLRADLSAHTIYATLSGGNNVGTISNMALWNFGSLSSAPTANGLTATISDLSITEAGFSAFSQSLGLINLGVTALGSVSTYGTITTTFVSTALDTPVPPWHVTAVPEPTTYALMGMGLACVMVARRRRHAA